MNSYNKILNFLGNDTTSNLNAEEVRSEVDQIYRCIDLETIIRFYDQKFWEIESEQEKRSLGVLHLENVAAHSFQVANTVLILSQNFREIDTARAIELALVHDQLEMITGDKDPVGKTGDGSDTHAFNDDRRKEKLREEGIALNELLSRLGPKSSALYESLITEILYKETREARFVKAIDKIQALAFVRKKKNGIISPAHLSFTIKYSKEGINRFPELLPYFQLIISDILEDIQKLIPAHFNQYCETTSELLNGSDVQHVHHPRRIALIGKSGAGKSTVAQLLQLQGGLQRLSTGKICRQISHLLFGNEEKQNTQKLDDCLTAIDSSIFLNAALRQASTSRGLCLDSLRFLSDYEVARAKGFKIVRVSASDEVRLSRLMERGQNFNLETDGAHRSETELDTVDVDFEVVNDGSLGELHIAIERILG